MTAFWETIAECLRAEVEEYGALLNLFQEQQQSLFARDAEAVLNLSTTIEQQVLVLQDCRRRREQNVAAFASTVSQPASSTLRALLPFVVAEARPLLEALIAEVNVLVHRVRRATRHNHALLARTVEVHQETLRQLRPDSFTKTYAPSGRVSLAPVRPTPALRATG